MEQQELQILPATTPGKDGIAHAAQREEVDQDVAIVEERRKRSKVRLVAIITALFVRLDLFPCSSIVSYQTTSNFSIKKP